MAKRAAHAEGFNFEQAMERLEAIVAQIEKGNVPLDRMIALYEEGAGLSRQCLEHLRGAELKLKKLSKDIDGSFTLTEE